MCFRGRAEGGVGSPRVIDRSEPPRGWVLGTESEIAPQPEAWLLSHGCGNLSYFPVSYKMEGMTISTSANPVVILMYQRKRM